ncbi:unnamed protein product [Paramecium octaurelia]|uniref:Transmembrane protein n=1 Tax=Paramecium octaurelia TaxID=43137 RepID=A0A8S1V196_PAROT|nr:unnamed protein product [Paramecium octaurelia]
MVILLMVLHQHLVVKISRSVYEKQRQEKKLYQIIDIKTFQHNFKLQFIKTKYLKKVFIDYKYSSDITIAYILILRSINFERRIQQSIRYQFEEIKQRGSIILENQIEFQKP